MSVTIPNLLSHGDTCAPAIGAPKRLTMTYEGLRAHMMQTVRTLRGLGIGRNDRIAIVLDNGPEMASAFVSIAAGATTAPLNPAYRDEEFEFYLSDLNAKALIVSDNDSPAIGVAARLGINVLRMSCRTADTAGSFELVGDAVADPSTDGSVRDHDIAMILHTSGTTSRPKMVPLSHTNICTSAQNISATLSLVPEDRCLNIMPLFHIHGLMGAVLSSLAAGASVHCSPGFNALRFFSWLKEVQPTWYTAVPTMHQAILSRAERNWGIIQDSNLRLIRSSSASLPSQVMAELEEMFSVPVIESYGMTEAAHQMASNPLPPQARKPGSVGLPAGPTIAIFDESGTSLDQCTVGEIVIRGENVTDGYEANPEANNTAFKNGWVRTGDQGYFDEDGYLIITGRLKEIINRGGEKISPLEVDEILMDHEAVSQAVTFALPHDKLGEDVAAAIVLRDGMILSEKELRDFATQRLAAFKVPRTIIFLEEIPKSATGKMQRIGLADKLGLTQTRATV